jgi:hypothetical protein
MDILDIGADLSFESRITGIENRTHEAYVGTKFDNNDEIRITIQNQDAYTLPSESFIYIEGKLLDTDGRPVPRTRFTTNAFAHLISECRYLLNGVEIDQTRNVGITTTMKGLASFSPNEARHLDNAGWEPSDEHIPVHTDGSFTAILPLRILMGFFEDYKKILMNCKQELVLVRSQNDLNCIVSLPAIPLVPAVPGGAALVPAVPLDRVKITITKLNWRMPYVDVSDATRLKLLRHLQEDKPIELGFRSWQACEKPLNTNTNKIEWQVQTTTHMERPRYVLLALQTNKRNVATADIFGFNHCRIRNVKLYLNENSYPYDNLNLNMTSRNAALLWEMYCKFRKSYYGKEPAPLIKQTTFISDLLLTIIDCSKQNEAVKSGAVDVRIEIEADVAFPANTTAFCVLLHDRIVDYTPLTNVVRKHT